MSAANQARLVTPQVYVPLRTGVSRAGDNKAAPAPNANPEYDPGQPSVSVPKPQVLAAQPVQVVKPAKFLSMQARSPPASQIPAQVQIQNPPKPKQDASEDLIAQYNAIKSYKPYYGKAPSPPLYLKSRLPTSP